ncbi:helix-turn-helix transcriptional regulator [Microbispora sp. NBRC 16548]|uniref:helix-turn-helix transcriptional regulator n=1 Tax=Microbispora sp. NBRC 16548 TaxID=3030994 RepID=UPI0024A5C327|nr:helix-turn-helix transcriptional regulator [Microbispora sp. NBRC 16548]GLX05627.1 transcriptional regulator [Microbispora sp. NBRC 16548]
MTDIVRSALRTLRTTRGVSRRELAEALGVHWQTIGYIERGERLPSLALARRMAKIFGVPVEELFSLAAEPVPSGTRRGRPAAGGVREA